RGAAREGGGELPRGHQEGEVPRDDLATDADRLPQREVEVVGIGGVRLAVDLGDPAGVVAERRRGARDVDVPALGEGLPVVERLELRELVPVRLDQLRDAKEDPLALRRTHADPGAVVEGAPRGPDGAVDVL